jgi:glycine betaine/choline ABC-type transport system substrate-binding protein
MESEQRRLAWAGAGLLAILTLAMAALWWLARPADIVIGSKNFTESRILAEIMAQAAERQTGLRARRRELGSTGLCWDALAKGAIDAYPEYTGTLLTDILKQQPLAEPLAALQAVRDGLRCRPDLTIGLPFGLNDTYVLAMRAADAAQRHVTCISDLAGHPDLTAGFTSEFNQRPDGWPGLARHYGIRLGRSPVDLSPGHMYLAVQDGQVAIISAFSTDARLRQFGLTVLADDRRFFPAYEALPVMRSGRLAEHPGLAAAWQAIAGRIDDATMTRLNQRVDMEGEDISSVAKSFLDGLPAPSPVTDLERNP